MLHERTEGWAAGLRLAALSLAGHPDPERFAAEFSGSERTVAEYLLAEVLERQTEEVRRLLLRTSILERVNGELADLLTGDSGGERVLAGSGGGQRVRSVAGRGAVVVPLPPAVRRTCCSWSCGAPSRVRWPRCTSWPPGGLRGTGSRWRRSGMPRRRGTGAWPPGCWPTTGPACIWTGRPPPRTSCWPGSPPRPARRMPSWRRWPRPMSWRRGRWRRRSGTWGWPSADRRRCRTGRRGQAQVLLGVVRLLLARQRGNLPAVAEEAQRLQALAEAPDAAQPGLGEELRALALVSLGVTEFWAARLEEARAAPGARRRAGAPDRAAISGVHRPGLPGGGRRSPGRLRGRQSAAGRRSSWPSGTAGPTSRPSAIAYALLGSALAWQGRLEEAEPWVQRAERTLRRGSRARGGAVAIHYVRGLLELARGRYADALAAFRAAERLAGRLAAPH